jgi:hypothetical protein
MDEDYHRAIQHKEKEIELILRLREISIDTPSEDYALQSYGIDNLCDRLELLAILYHDTGDLDHAIVLLAVSRRIAESAGFTFEGEDLLREYLDKRAPDLAKLI